MNAVAERLKGLEQRGRCAVIPYITAGYPNWEATKELLNTLPAAGADLVELGIPFSDPVADGPVIQKASEEALSQGITMEFILKGLRGLNPAAPMIAMGYYNPILRYGVEEFAKNAAASGIRGLIVPDLPPEEGEELIDAAKRYGIATIFLVAPTTPKERIAIIAQASTGFIYLVSLKGVTGSHIGNLRPIISRIEEIRSVTSLPVCVGFGISTPDQARAIAAHAQGVIIGSAVIKALKEKGVEGVRRFIEEMAQAVRG
jgi:tryptophan synthase alpha chain